MNDLIEKLSDLRSQFNCFNENEREAYSTLSEAIKVLSERPEPCEDAISRQRLLNDLKELITAWKKYPIMEEQIKGVETTIEYVEMVPSLAPKRKTGKWIEYDSDEDKYDVIKCPCCKHTFTVDAYHWTDIGFVKDDFKFCPNCGSKNGDARNE